MQGHAAVHVCEALVDVGSGRTDAAWHGYMVAFVTCAKQLCKSYMLWLVWCSEAWHGKQSEVLLPGPLCVATLWGQAIPL